MARRRRRRLRANELKRQQCKWLTWVQRARREDEPIYLAVGRDDQYDLKFAVVTYPRRKIRASRRRAAFPNRFSDFFFFGEFAPAHPSLT